ncbi:MAG: ABC transporter ATP-binding protein [Acidobacteria bacterium]|nr:ABC transporter ATP-binding protein [Acidobacteriota bacterium]
MIEIRALGKRYGDFVAVDDVTLSTEPGEVFGFLGPNGAGKTTTIRILAGLSTPSSGEVRIGGLDVVREARKVKAMTGFIPDRPHLYEKLTGNEHLRFVADLYGVAWKSREDEIGELAYRFDLTDWLDSRIENYSHGMKQKLVLISSLVHEPKLLIIDEPMVGLDVLAQKLVKQLFREEASRGRTIFLTTHTMSVAETVCDRMAIIHRGRVIARGTPAEIKERGGTPGNPLEDVFLSLTHDPVGDPVR